MSRYISLINMLPSSQGLILVCWIIIYIYEYGCAAVVVVDDDDNAVLLLFVMAVLVLLLLY